MFLLVACSGPADASDTEPAPLPKPGPGQAAAILAGGCFWCLESDFDKLAGVRSTTSGYVGGHTQMPTYEDVTGETSGHKEAVYIVYDSSKLDYDRVLDWFWRHVDPTDDGGQFCDRGDSYRTLIVALDKAQKDTAEASKAALDAKGWLPGRIVTEIVPAATFWPAEVYHQDFHTKSPLRYGPYRTGCGRDRKVKEIWAKAPS